MVCVVCRAPSWHDHVFKDSRGISVETHAPNVSVIHDVQHDISLVGRVLSEYSRKILTVPVYSFTGAAEREIVRDGFESMCFSG